MSNLFNKPTVKETRTTFNNITCPTCNQKVLYQSNTSGEKELSCVNNHIFYYDTIKKQVYTKEKIYYPLLYLENGGITCPICDKGVSMSTNSFPISKYICIDKHHYFVDSKEKTIFTEKRVIL